MWVLLHVLNGGEQEAEVDAELRYSCVDFLFRHRIQVRSAGVKERNLST